MELPRGQEAEEAIEVPGLSLKVVLVGVGVEGVAQLEDFLLGATGAQLAQSSLGQALQQGPRCL